MKTKLTRIISFALVIIMVLAAIPGTALAATAPKIIRTGSGIEKIETLEYTFELDPAAVGDWLTYDFIRSTESIVMYDPNRSDKWPAKDLVYFLGVSLYSDGTASGYHQKYINQNHWTKGYQLWGAGWNVVPAYQIREINGKSYMFLEWKNGDYERSGEVPGYYVLEKISNTTPSTANAVISKPSMENDHVVGTYIDDQGYLCDTVDYVFELDPAAVGEWTLYDFTDNFNIYNPRTMGKYPRLDEAPYRGNSIHDDGTLITHWNEGGDGKYVWSNGYMYWTTWGVAPAYQIREIDDRTFMFIEWKSGDYQRTGKVLGYYVMEKISDTPAT